LRRVLLGFLVLLSCSCAQKATITKSEREKAVKIGNEAVVKLMREMKRNLGMALKKGGFPEAIKFCSSKAQLLAKKVNEELVVVKVKRVSDKYRNLKDKPDSLDMKVIDFFKKKLKEGKLPPYYLVKTAKNGKEYVIFYKPIRVAPFCLNCHGDPTRMDPKVLSILREKYPNDRALGYKAGDLRGVFKVEIPVEKLKEK
jgi:hypothetical protein